MFTEMFTPIATCLAVMHCTIDRISIVERISRRLTSYLGIVMLAIALWGGFGESHYLAWAAPASPEPTSESRLQVSLVSEMQSIQPGTPIWVALQVKIQDGWHVYWQNPGDSGAAPIVKWQLPEGFTAGDLVFPYPKRLPIPPLMNFGYTDEVYYLAQLTPGNKLAAGSRVTLRANADILVCKVECIPEQASVDLALPVTADPPVPNSLVAEAFAQTRRSLPQPSLWQVSYVVDAQNLTLQVAASGLQEGQVRSVEFFPYQDGVIENAAPQIFAVDPNRITLSMQRSYRDPITTVEGVLVVQEVLDGQVSTQAFAIQANPKQAIAADTSVLRSSPTIGQTIVLALLGGIVLNLMPCVFPVLSLKALTIAQQVQQSPQQARLGGLMFTAGVLTSFAALAGVLLLLRGVGQQIGWGFQLQSPVFVLLMAYVLFAVGLSLSGVFTVGASMMGLGHGLAARSGYAGEFFTGMLTTVMATPCTAPFMATAVSVALVQPPPVAIVILLTLGLGLALPYLLISLTPALRRWLPKPGAWMEVLQQFLAFPIYAAAAWLVWVLTLQTGTDGLAVALGGMVLLSFAAWLHQKTQMSRQFWRRVGTVGSLGAIVIALTLAPLVHNTNVQHAQTPTQTDSATTQTSIWKPYTSEQLASLRQTNEPVFINFSASWCVTCLVNERVALSQPEVVRAFQDKSVTLIKADWTNRNPDITQALSRYGRSGVPLYVLYPAGLARETSVILPQVLTPAIVQDALANLSSPVTSHSSSE